MACKYYYKGHEFQTESELDDFLLEKRPYESTLGDLVFSRTSAQLHVAQQLSTIAKDAHALRKKYKEMLDSGKAIYNEDGEIALEDPPYIGVNKFLSGLKNSEGQLLFPEFREEEYWSRRYSNWKIGSFTKDEIAEFELDPNNLPKITDSSQHKQMREQMTKRWKNQSYIGNAIHDVLRVCFSKENGIYNITLDEQTLRNKIESNISKKNAPYLTDTSINQTIKYAQQLYQDLMYKFGNDLDFYPEFIISQNTNVIHNGTPTTLLGIIDLLIVDSTGKAHIIDYKTSIHGYSEFGVPKKTAYTYQTATYARMLEKYGLNMYGSSRLVAPIQITNFRKDGDNYAYDGILAPQSFTTISTSLSEEKLWENIDEFMPAPFKLSITTQEATQQVKDIMSEWFPDYSSVREITQDEVIKMLKQWKKLTPDENNIFTLSLSDGSSPITANSEPEFVQKVTKFMQSQPANRLRYTADIKRAINEAIKNGIKSVDFPSPKFRSTDREMYWLRDNLSPYCNGTWEILDNELLESFGILTLKTKDGFYPKQIDFIRVSTNNLKTNYRKYLSKDNPLKNRTLLTGSYEPDVAQKSRSNSMMLEAVNGNIELMETLLLINQMSGIEGYTVGNVRIVNPKFGDGLLVTNEQLLYCWTELNKHHRVQNNKISDGTIKFATMYEQCRMLFDHIMTEGDNYGWRDSYRKLSSLRECRTVLDENIDASAPDKIAALNKVLSILNTVTTSRTGYNYLDKIYTNQAEINSKEVSLHNAILFAIAEANGIKFRQQLSDHDKWIESIMIFKDGWSGTYFDNPGNMNSETLNLVTQLTTQAYQNVRDEMQKEKVEITRLIRNLKRQKSFGKLEERTIGNQVSLYENMTEVTADGDFMFKNPNRLQGAEREFLEYCLYKINKNRYPLMTDEELQKMKETDDVRYYRVPLARGSDDSLVSTVGLLSALKGKLRYLMPSVAFKKAREKLEGIFNAEVETSDQQDSQILFTMTNLFDGGENEARRLDKIKSLGIENLEHNLETLLYKHLFAYSIKDNVDGVFPMIKAAMIHLATQGSIQNNVFSKDMEYINNYIRNKIFNQSIVDPKLQGLANKLGLIKSAASKATLAFAPVQAIYQPLQGLWVDISLMIRKPDGKDSFTFNNFKKALKIVYSDLSHFSDTPTLCSAFNELFGLNDIDMNTYVDKISTSRKGIWNFTNMLFKFASRPDYYNRMTIFIAQMLGDGCYYAHHINEKGELIYDWKKDKRFEAFANGRVSDPKYNEQRSLYYAVAKQFEAERTRNKDGTLFKLDMSNPQPLPRAYTNKEAESMKSLADDIYGYYSHEKRSLIMSTLAGSMWLQFKTYWSGKKNQYLQSGGVRLRGNWEHYTETIIDRNTGERKTVKYYYQVDQSGNILYNEPPLSEDEIIRRGMQTIAPVMQWKGLWQEGIMATFAELVINSKNAGSFKQGWDATWNNQDENLRRAYRSNIKQAGYDLTMWLIGGSIIGALLADWLKELKEDNIKNRDVVTGLGITAANIAVMAVKNSFMDFNAIESIGGPLGQWTPFSFEWGARMTNQGIKVLTGEEDLWDGIVKTSGGLKQIKPVLDAIKPDMFRTKREGGTFGT